MEKDAMRKAIKAQRLKKKVTIAQVAKKVGKNPTFVAAALNGKSPAGACGGGEGRSLVGFEYRTSGCLERVSDTRRFSESTDPFKYRLMEVIGVYGDSLREMANEMFGYGIMSAIDFTLDMEKVTGSQGEARCQITLNGKWLEYKTF